MPEAFCGLETVRKNAQWTLCALWEKKNVLCERKNSSANLIGLISSRGSVLFLTEGHRWTEHTKAHRDIKSTDITEPYSHKSLTPLPHSFREHVLPLSRTHPSPFKDTTFPFQEHALLLSRTCPSTAKNTPFLMLDKALLQRNLQPSDFMQVTETDEAYILNGNLMLVDIMTQRHIMTKRTCFCRVFYVYRQNDRKT